MPIYTGGCHCGAIRFEVSGEITELTVCNCSICTQTAYLHWEIEPKQFHLLTPESAFQTYQFGTMTSKNHFCRKCGISPFRRSRTSPQMIDINARCLDGVDAETLPVVRFDGQNWEQAAQED